MLLARGKVRWCDPKKRRRRKKEGEVVKVGRMVR